MSIKKHKLASRFERATEDVRKYRTILRVVGERGTGKTRLGLTGPEPILYQSFDNGLEGVIEEFISDGKEIYPKQYKWHPGSKDAQGDDGEFNQDYAVKLREEFEADLYFALDNGARTIVLDKETDIWEMYRYAEFGGPSDAPKDYPALNQRYMAMINAVKSYDANLIVIQGMKDEWGTQKKVNSKGVSVDSPRPTGRRVPSGFSRLDELVFAEILCRRVGKNFFFDFRSDFDDTFGKCRQNAEMCGVSIPACTFPELGTFLIDGSTEEDWQ